MTNDATPERRSATPLWDAYQQDLNDITTSFAIPGHKMRTDLAGPAVATDRPLQLGVEEGKLNWNVVHQAEALAAEAYGADTARFSVNGSSAANQAALMTVAGPDDIVIVSRAAHKSILFGLIYSGARPVWVPPRVDISTGLPIATEVGDIIDALMHSPQAKAVLVTDPTYVGSVSDTVALAQATHDADIPLIVDAAWGAHFGWHPALPPAPMACGADIAIVSTHKTLPAYTQSAILLARRGRVDLDRLHRAFDGTQTTSPAASILASIDLARATMVDRGAELVSTILPALTRAKETLRLVPGLNIAETDRSDVMKLVILTGGVGVDGRDIAEDLYIAGIDVEMANRDVIIPQVTVADTPESIATLTHALLDSFTARRGKPRPTVTPAVWNVVPDVVVTPREAFFASSEMVPWSKAEGRISADVLAPYPPGIPVISPGERFTPEVFDVLRQSQEAGVRVAYGSDPTLTLLRVLN